MLKNSHMALFVIKNPSIPEIQDHVSPDNIL